MEMKRISSLPNELPKELRKRLAGTDIYDSSCSPEARVYFADTEGGYFIKVGAAKALRKETVMTRYFHSLGLGAEVVFALSEGRDILVTRKICGCDLTTRKYLENPKKLAQNMGECLRALHETVADRCPVSNRTADYLDTVAEGYRVGRFDPSYIDPTLKLADMESAMRFIDENKGLLDGRVLLHGDFCLPNIIFNGDALSGYIDLGGAGIGDRHIDLFWGAWTLNFNLGTDKYRKIFFDAYGRELVDREKISLVSAAEAFG